MDAFIAFAKTCFSMYLTMRVKTDTYIYLTAMEDMNRQALPKDPETELAESLPVPQPDKDKDKDKEVKENEDIEETAPAEPAKGKEGKKRKRKKGNKKAVKEGGDEVRPIKQSQKKAAVPLDVVNDGKSVVGDIPK